MIGQTASGPRLLLRRLRDALSSPGDPESRLGRVVRIIAADMVAEVCSIYLVRPGDVLELFATEGLKAEAVHVTRLRVGEGLVGDIAAHGHTLNLSDAWRHPKFVYLPETGEERYHSLLGVPIQRDGRPIGVIVVQNRTQRHYSEEEVEVLQTVAMVLAEIVGQGQLIDLAELQAGRPLNVLPVRLEGLRLADGLGQGQAVLHEPRVEVVRLIADDVGIEKARLQSALDALSDDIDRKLQASDLLGGGEHQEVLETYRMFADDQGWRRKLDEAVQTGLTAEAAVKKVQEETHRRMIHISDPYIRERLADLEDLANRLLRHLLGRPATAAAGGLPDEAIIVARHMGPADLLDYDPKRLRGVVLEEGTPTAHVAIIARAMNIPMLGGLPGLLEQVEPGAHLIVDADHNQLFVRPSPSVVEAVSETIKIRARRDAELAALRLERARTLDGYDVRLNINCGLLADVAHLIDSGADGIGLYRTELTFMVRSAFPDVGSQTDLYTKVLEGAGGKPVIFRTLDVGGDKKLPYFPTQREENPALGWRAVRIGLDHPRILGQQLRALISAAGRTGAVLKVMFPMIAEVAELDRVRALIDSELARAQAAGQPMPVAVKVGTMIEVPSLLWQLDALLKRVDFVSVGSNDMMQFFFAADRGSPHMAERYDLLSPPMLTMLKSLAASCDAAGVEIGVCGEAAGRPLEALALIAIGYRNLSMSAGAVGRVKKMILSVTLSSVADFVGDLASGTDHSVREALRNFARDRGIDI